MTIMKKTHMYHVSTLAQLIHVHNVLVYMYNERHYFHQFSLTDTAFMKTRRV